MSNFKMYCCITVTIFSYKVAIIKANRNEWRQIQTQLGLVSIITWLDYIKYDICLKHSTYSTYICNDSIRGHLRGVALERSVGGR